jgi:hypothetical protein
LRQLSLARSSELFFSLFINQDANKMPLSQHAGRSETARRVVRLKPGNDMPTSLDQIRKHPKLYLGDVEPNGMLLAARLAESALIAGALLVKLRMLDSGWIAVSGESDWITPNAQKVRQGIFIAAGVYQPDAPTRRQAERGKI